MGAPVPAGPKPVNAGSRWNPSLFLQVDSVMKWPPACSTSSLIRHNRRHVSGICEARLPKIWSQLIPEGSKPDSENGGDEHPLLPVSPLIVVEDLAEHAGHLLAEEDELELCDRFTLRGGSHQR